MSARVVDHHRFQVKRRVICTRPPDDSSQTGGIAVSEVVGAVYSGKRVTRKGESVPLRCDLALREELDDTRRRAVKAHLRATHETVAVLEANLRPAVEAEQVFDEAAEIASA